MATTNKQYLVTCDWLQDHLEDNLIIVDCHWDINAFLRAHIPGAIPRAGHPFLKGDSNGQLSKHLPDEAEFIKLMSDMGITNDSNVVLYDEWDNHFATRLWWLMDYYGLKNVKILDGGWQAWLVGGYPVSADPVGQVAKVDACVPVVDQSKYTDLNEVMGHHDSLNWQILDVRSDEEFVGERVENKRAGHIPNAVHLEWKKMLEVDPENSSIKRFGSVAFMEDLLSRVGIDKHKTIAVHCQAGVRASFMVFCLVMLGYENVKLYDGSMAEWANLEETPLEV